MPKYAKKHNKQWGKYPHFNNQVPIPIPPMYPLPVFPTMVPMVPSLGIPNNVYANADIPHSEPKNVEMESSTPTDAEKACLHFFEQETLKTADKNHTDIVIIDFDSALLATPQINLDLFDRDSRSVLEYRLGPDKVWLQNPLVLKRCFDESKWESNLLEIAKLASQSPSTLLVITTSRTTKQIKDIDNALKSVGVEHVDHYACSSSNGTKELEERENNDHEDDTHVSGFTMGSNAKFHMLGLLMDTYVSVERAYIFDGYGNDRKSYDHAAHEFIKEGWVTGENFYISPVTLRRFRLPASQERNLVTEVLKDAGLENFETTVVNVSWIWKTNSESRKILIEYAIKNIVDEDNEEDRFTGSESLIALGDLPMEFRGLASAHGQLKPWQVIGYEVDSQRRLLFTLVPLAYTTNDIVVEVAKLNWTFTPKSYVEIADGPKVQLYIFQKRELRVQLKKPTSK